ncbi:MAG: glycine cleavage T C-terminal barrel domain-containing protein [Calditrichaceae bacterium]
MHKKLNLHEFHFSNGAQFISSKNWHIPANYGNVNSELHFVRDTVGILDRSYLGKISLNGTDTIDLINRISTNDMTKLFMSTVCDTVFITPKGRIVDYCRVIKQEPEYIIISSYVDCTNLMGWINRFLILEDVDIKDASKRFVWLTLLGPRSRLFLGALTDQTILPEDELIWINKFDTLFPAVINNNFYVPAYNICLPANNCLEIVEQLKDVLLEFDGGMIGDTAFQITRVESGMPDWGTELTEDYNPHEARLLKAVSFTKGCYTGQEVIARLDTYDKVQKYLMIIEMQEVINSTPPFDVYLDDEKIGVLTSYAYDPLEKRSVGLGYIKKMYAHDDYNLQVEVDIAERRIESILRLPPAL